MCCLFRQQEEHFLPQFSQQDFYRKVVLICLSKRARKCQIGSRGEKNHKRYVDIGKTFAGFGKNESAVKECESY